MGNRARSCYSRPRGHAPIGRSKRKPNTKGNMKYINVIDRVGDSRIAAIENRQWVSLSAGCARLEGRENSEAPVGNQCVARWHGGSPVADEDGVIYHPAPLRRRLAEQRQLGMVRITSHR